MISFFNFRLTKKTQLKKPIKGFTLVELLVSLALFTSVITIATGALFSAQAINARLEQTQVVLDGVNLSMEMMTRDIRYGSAFYCDTSVGTAPDTPPTNKQDCLYGGSGGRLLFFKPVVQLVGSTDYSMDRVVYYLSSDGIIYKNEYAYVGGVYNKKTIQITTPDVKVDALTFFLTGSDIFPTDFTQPLVTVIVSGVTIPNKQTVPVEHFSLQTSVSSRRLDN